MIHLIKSAVERLDLVRETVELSGSSCWNVQKDFGHILQEYNYEKHPFIFKLDGVLRASVSNNPEWFNSISRLSYPPKNKVNFGRCNFPQEPVFYGSSENGVPIFEVRPKIGQYVVVSHWDSKTSKSIEIYGAAVGVEAMIAALNKNDSFIKTLKQDDIFKETTDQTIKDIDRYVAELFKKDASGSDRLYWLTSAITKIHFENMVLEKSGLKLQGLLYPSVASLITGNNIALTTDFVDENLKLGGASMYKVLLHERDKVEYKLAPIKTLMRSDSSGNLEWQDISERYAGRFFTLSPQTPTLPFDPSMILDREEYK